MRTLLLALFMAGILSSGQCVQAEDSKPLKLKARVENQLQLQRADMQALTLQNRVGQVDGLSVIATHRLPVSKNASLPVDFTRLQMEGYTYSHVVGLPMLPVRVELIELPQGAEPVVRITKTAYKDIDLREAGYPAPLYPAQAPVSKSAKEAPDFEYDAYAYAANAFIGGRGFVSGADNDLVQVETLGEMRGTRLGRLTVSPFQYNPATHTLRVYTTLDFDVEFKGADMAATHAKKERYYSPFFNGLKSEVINPLDSRSKGNAPKAEIYNSPIRYLIVADPMFKDALQDFIKWKTRLGFDVVEAYTDDPEVGSSLEELKAYLQGLYDNASAADPAPSFILFVGDVEQIPAKEYTYSDSYGSSVHVSDLYLCEYTGDHFPDVQYGRMSATSVEELLPQLRKTMDMENIDPARASFMDTTMLIAGDDYRFNDSHLNPTINYLQTYYFKDTLNRYCHAYLAPESVQHSADIIQNINDGLSFGIYTAHGYAAGWADPEVSINDVNNLRNKGKYPFLVGNCCLTGQFDEPYCFGESLLRKDSAGAVAYIGTSNSSYFDHDVYWAIGYTRVLMAGVEHTYEDTELGANDVLFHTHGEPYEDWALTAFEYIHAGNMAVERAAQDLEEYYWQIYHVFGDPSFMPFTHAPQRVEAEYDTLLVVGSGEMVVNTEPYARVVLSRDTEVLAVTMADENGLALLNTDAVLEEGTAWLAVAAQNHAPLLDEIQFAMPDTKYAVVTGQSLLNGAGQESTVVSYADTCVATYTVKNIGVEPVGSVHLALSTTSEYLSFANGSYTYEKGLALGEEIEIPHEFLLLVDPSVPDRQTLSYTVTLTMDDDPEASMSRTFFVAVQAPDVVVSSFVIVDTASSTPNGVIDNGETVTGVVSLTNQGRTTARHLFLQVTSPDAPYLELPAEPVEVGDLAPDSSVTVSFAYSAKDAGVKYTIYTLELTAETEGREMMTEVQSYIEPIVETFESGDFSFAAWADESDWIIDQSQVHNGTYSAASAAIGDGETSSLSIDVNVALDDKVGFYYYTSTESVNSFGDYLHFYIDGTRMGRWAGESNGWKYVEYAVKSGLHNLEWRYVKDMSDKAGQDRVWVDDIRLPIGSLDAIPFANEAQKTDGTSSMMLVNRAGHGLLTLTFNAPAGMEGDLYLLNAMGQKVMTLDEGLRLPAGAETRTFGIEGLSSGLYICVFETLDALHTVKFVLTR